MTGQMPRYAITYVAYRPDAPEPGLGVLKVGRAWRWSRIDGLAARGWHILVCARGTDWTWESEALKNLARWFPGAFDTPEQGALLLPLGRGWTECFRVYEVHLQLAIELCFEGFGRGNEQGANTATADRREGSRVRWLHAGTARSESDCAGAVAPHGHLWASGVGAGIDSCGDLPGAGGDRDDHRPSADAGRLGVSLDLPSTGLGVDSAHPTLEGRHPHSTTLGVPRPPGSGHVRTCHGCGGRGRTGEYEGAGASSGGSRVGRACCGLGRVGRRAGASPRQADPTDAARCASDRMSGASFRQVLRLRPLRHRETTTRQMGGARALHRPNDQVRRRSRMTSASMRKATP